MKLRFLALLWFCLFPVFAQAQTKLEATAATLFVLDYLQTRNIALNLDKYEETNPILGSSPDIGEVNRYFLVTGLASYLAYNYVLPEKWKETGLLLFIAVEGTVVANNVRIGIGFNF